MTDSRDHLEVALFRVSPREVRPEVVGVSRDQHLAAVVHQALCDELDEAARRVDHARPEAPDEVGVE
jgi:hypothetical protein